MGSNTSISIASTFASSPEISPWRRRRPSGLGAPAGKILGHLREKLSGTLSPNFLRELDSLSKEQNSEMFFEGLIALGQRQVQERKEEVAAAIFSLVSETLSREFPARPENYSLLVARAQAERDALIGRGHGGRRFEVLGRRLAGDVVHPVGIASLACAGLAYGTVRAGVLGRLLAAPGRAFLTSAWQAQGLATLAAFSAENIAYVYSGRLLSQATGASPDWSLTAQGRDLLGSALFLGAIKLGSGAGNAAFHRLSGLRAGLPAGISPGLASARTLFHQGGLFLGVLGGRWMEARLDGREQATTAVDVLATWMQLNLAGRLVGGLAPGLGALQQELILRGGHLGRSLDSRNFREHSAPGLLSVPLGPSVSASSLGDLFSRPVLIAANGGEAGGKRAARVEKIERVESRIRYPEKTASKSLLALIHHLVEKFPDTFGHLRLADAKKLIKEYPKILSEIELARINSPRRLEIAQAARDWVLDRFNYSHPDGTVASLREMVSQYLAQEAENFKIEEVLPPEQADPGPGYRAIIRHRGRVLDTSEKIIEWALEQVLAGKISPSLARKVEWSAKEAYGGWAKAENRFGYFKFDAPKRVVLVSGGAELAPLKFFAEAGSQVLVIDLKPLGKKAEAIHSALGGVYQFQADLLNETPQIIGAIRTFAGLGKVDLGFYSYADRLVWLLAAASEAVSLGVGGKARVAFTLRSPSVVAEVPAETAMISEENWNSRRLKGLKSIGGQFTPNLLGGKEQSRLVQSIVIQQRLPYAIGNWLGKTILAEARIADGEEASAPVGPISWTGSMQANKLIVYGLRGAHLFDVDIAEPYTSRDIQAFVWYHDFKNRSNEGATEKNRIDKALTATEDHADLGIFAQGCAMGSLVYASGIAGLLGADGRNLIPEGLKQGKPGSYLLPPEASRWQKILRGLKGGRAFSKAPLAEIRRIQEPGDQFLLTIDERGELASIYLQKPNGDGLEFKNIANTHSFERVIHLGKPWNGLIERENQPWNHQGPIKQNWSYDSKKDVLVPEFTRINPKMLGDSLYLGFSKDDQLDYPPRANFRGLFGQSPATSLTYPLNFLWGRALAELIWDFQKREPSFQIDPTRTLVHAVKIERAGPSASALSDFEMRMLPREIYRVSEDELLGLEIDISHDRQEKIRGDLTLLVRGNQVRNPKAEIKIEDRRLTETTREAFSDSIQTMDKGNLERFGRYFDPNVLHQRSIVAQVAGFPEIPVPSLGLTAQLEALIRSKATHFDLPQVQLKTLAARFEKPLFAGREYRLESGFDTQDGLWRFQILESTSREILAEGTYSLLEWEFAYLKGMLPYPALREKLMDYGSKYGFGPFPPPKDLKAYYAKLQELSQVLERKVEAEYGSGRVRMHVVLSSIFGKLGDFQKSRYYRNSANIGVSYLTAHHYQKQNELAKKRDREIEQAVYALEDLVDTFVNSTP